MSAARPAIIIYAGVNPILGVRTAKLLDRDKPDATGMRCGAIYAFENGDVLYAYRTKAGAVVVRPAQSARDGER